MLPVGTSKMVPTGRNKSTGCTDNVSGVYLPWCCHHVTTAVVVIIVVVIVGTIICVKTTTTTRCAFVVPNVTSVTPQTHHTQATLSGINV